MTVGLPPPPRASLQRRRGLPAVTSVKPSEVGFSFKREKKSLPGEMHVPSHRVHSQPALCATTTRKVSSAFRCSQVSFRVSHFGFLFGSFHLLFTRFCLALPIAQLSHTGNLPLVILHPRCCAMARVVASSEWPTRLCASITFMVMVCVPTVPISRAFFLFNLIASNISFRVMKFMFKINCCCLFCVRFYPDWPWLSSPSAVVPLKMIKGGPGSRSMWVSVSAPVLFPMLL